MVCMFIAAAAAAAAPFLSTPSSVEEPVWTEEGGPNGGYEE